MCTDDVLRTRSPGEAGKGVSGEAGPERKEAKQRRDFRQNPNLSVNRQWNLEWKVHLRVCPGFNARQLGFHIPTAIADWLRTALGK